MLDWIIVSGCDSDRGQGGCTSPGGYCAQTVESRSPNTHPSITSTNKRLAPKTLFAESYRVQDRHSFICWVTWYRIDTHVLVEMHGIGSILLYLLSYTVQDRHCSIWWVAQYRYDVFFELHGTGLILLYFLSYTVQDRQSSICWVTWYRIDTLVFVELHGTGSILLYFLSYTVQDRQSSICWVTWYRIDTLVFLELHGTGSIPLYLLTYTVPDRHSSICRVSQGIGSSRVPEYPWYQVYWFLIFISRSAYIYIVRWRYNEELWKGIPDNGSLLKLLFCYSYWMDGTEVRILCWVCMVVDLNYLIWMPC